MESKLIEAIGITKAFSGAPVLRNVSFELLHGEVHALMGENGAGKSTLSKIITGIYQADEGQVFVEGKPVQFNNTREAIAGGVSIVTQEFSLLPDFSVSENIFLTDKRFYKKGFISDKTAMAAETYNLLKLFDMESFIDPYEKVINLSVAQMQVVEILKAVSTEAKAIILDEPTASLSNKEIQMLFNLVRQLKAEGVGFIIVSHKISEIYEIADRITVLRDGLLILNGVVTKELQQKDLIKAMVGREINERKKIHEKEGIGKDLLEPYADRIHSGIIVLLNTGWSQKRGYSLEYYHDWPYLAKDGAEWLLEKRVKGVGIDCMSMGGWYEGTGRPCHEVLLPAHIWILEEINIPEELNQYEKCWLFAFPIKLKGFSGAPVRAVAAV